MKLSLFDLHCDTPYEMFQKKQQLGKNQLAVSLQKAAKFEQYVQVAAFWCEKALSDEEGWARFDALYQGFLSDPAFTRDDAKIIRFYPQNTACRHLFIPAVEDLRILAGIESRIDLLAQKGVRIVTPLWAGNSCIGGAHDTENGLTDFGKQVLPRALRLGMLLDISHASIASADEIFDLCARFDRPVLATHSNSYSACPVSRNLRDEQIREVIRSGGLIGLNLYHRFIKADGDASIDDLCLHIEKMLSLGARDHLCIGSDFDGGEPLSEIPDLSALPRLAETLLQKNYPERLVHKLFFENAHRFATQYFTM
ncbi:MAG: membrane dipeptidase [Clostridia bacterium]|nr:membrane dipeptidase [Clostridia bacterium]